LQKTKIVSSGLCEIVLDTSSIIPYSLILINTETSLPLSDSCFIFNFNRSLIRFNNYYCNNPVDILIYYRITIYNLGISLSIVDSASSKNPPDSFNLSNEKRSGVYDLNTGDGLIKTGNISRGISAGNTQGASLQSSLDIRLSGKLNNDVEITAVITDNNIPVQPDGNTRQLQEFDKVFIEISKGNTRIRAGDIELFKPDGYFLNYTKKTQGASFVSSAYNDKSFFNGDSSRQTIMASAGISKGKFARNTFTGIDGNQGPYKLKGAENEQFIIILSGTEKVYINGELLVRGQSEDYVIDYNLGELSFTPSRLITSDSRIVIEFEYSEKSYMRSLFTGSYVYTDDKALFRLNFFSEQDAKNQPLQQTLDEDDRLVLQQAGDNPMNAVVHGWDSIAFSGDYVLYAMTDTLGYDSIFVYSINPDSAFYKVSFSFVGNGNGDYVQDKSLANGRVFKWVEPQGSTRQGDHIPYIVLIAPKKQQMVTACFEYQLSDNLMTGIELAFSNNDLNTFSSIDQNNNQGTAAKIYIRHSTLPGNNNEKNKLVLKNELTYEFAEASFLPVDRFRNVEFSRDWNLSETKPRSNEHILTGSIFLFRGKIPLAMFRSELFYKSAGFTANKNSLSLQYLHRFFRISHNLSLAQSNSSNFSSVFFRQKGQAAVYIKPVAVGCGFDQEINLWKTLTDSLLTNSYDYIEYEPFVETGSDSSRIQARIWYKNRITRGVHQFSLLPQLQSEEAGIKFSSQSSFQRVSLISAYRSSSSLDSLGSITNTDKNLVSRLEHSFSIFNKGISSFLYYEAGSGFESKKEFSYLEVTPGQGQYTWNDYNQNGIRELDEFETAIYQDEANYIRILIPSNEFIQVFTLQFNETFIVEPSRFLNNDTLVVNRILSRFSNRFQFSINRKTRSENIGERFLPFLADISDTSLITLNSGLSNTIFFNKAHPVFSIRYRYSDFTNKAMLINGFESRQMRTNELQILWNLTKTIGTDIQVMQGRKNNLSELSVLRNYHILQNQFSLVLNFQPDSKKRFSLFSRYKHSENLTGGLAEQSVILSAGPEFRFPFIKTHTVTLRLTYHDVKYNAPDNTPIAFEMLESLVPGTNFTWNITLQYQITKTIQLNFLYEGRQPQEKPTIHYGSIQIRALL
jgi:hypothetical protein